MKTWYLKHPISEYYDKDIKAQALKAKAKIIDIAFIGDDKSADDCPTAKGINIVEQVEPVIESHDVVEQVEQKEVKRRGRPPK